MLGRPKAWVWKQLAGLLGCLTSLERSWACLRLAPAACRGMGGPRFTLKLYNVLGIICENVDMDGTLSTDSLHVLQRMQ